MNFEFKLPDIGEGTVEGEIVKWLVKPGDPIVEDQPMVEVMTDKATVVLPSPRNGKVLETRGKEGEIAKVGSVIVVIAVNGAGAPAAASAPAAAKSSAAPSVTPTPTPNPKPPLRPPAPARSPRPPRASSRASAASTSPPSPPPAATAR
jgi:pyruvate dehydrogenase E2 component (dihydrolipoamide acetyltransferase)